MSKFEVGQKVWDTHNNCVYTLKSSETKYGTIIWDVEENEFEWREDWFIDVPIYVNNLQNYMEAMEKKYEDLKRDVNRYFELTHTSNFEIEWQELVDKLSKVGDRE